MKQTSQEYIVLQVNLLSQKLRGAYDLDPLMHLIGDAKYVLLGEAAYGSSDYFLWRARISQRLINEKCFSFIAVEGDWNDCYKINRYLKGYPDSGNRAYEVLNNFRHWPSWIWANWETVAFTEWLKEYNSLHRDKIGFYGLDIYNLFESIDAIISYLKKNYPELINNVKRAYMCLEPFSEDIESFTWTPKFIPDQYENEIIALLKGLQVNTPVYDSDSDAAIYNKQNIKAIKDADNYFKTLLKGGVDSFNNRDSYMAYTLDQLMNYYGKEAKGIIWAHNSHVGDERSANIHKTGLVNLGQLVRERHKNEGVILTGSGSFSGDVIAAKTLGDSLEKITIPEAQSTSWEDILHNSGANDKLLILKDAKDSEEFIKRRLHRTIGTIYNPENESLKNYISTALPDEFDAYLFIDHIQPLSPLHPEKDYSTPPQTFPWGI